MAKRKSNEGNSEWETANAESIEALRVAAMNYAEHAHLEGAPHDRALAALITSARQLAAFQLLYGCEIADAAVQDWLKSPPLSPVE